MKFLKHSVAGLVAALTVATAVPAAAAVRITEVAPWGSGNSPYAADWFELTNTGASAVSIVGWKIDDDSASFSKAVALSGISSIAAGESVVFIETSSASTVSSFIATWFGSSAPAGLQIGTYSGSGVGLSASGDAVNVYNASGTLQAGVTFGASDSSSPYSTFDNAAGLNGTTISLLSAAGVNGAFVAAADSTEIGSPGRIANAVAAVPEPESYAMLLAGLGLVGLMIRRRMG